MDKLIVFLVIVVASCIGLFLWIHLGHKNASSNGKKALLEPYLFILPVFLLLVFLYGFPLINSFLMAFQNYKLTALDKISFNGLDNFRKLFEESDFGMIVANSIIYVVASVAGQFILGMILALALRKKFWGRGLYQAVVFLPWAFSGFVIGLIFRWSFNGEYGVVNFLIARIINSLDTFASIAWLGTEGLSLLVVILAMIWMGVPFFAIMILAALQSIPTDVYEAADVDGCGGIRKFFAITIPYIKPTIIITLLLRTIWIFNSMDLVVVITQGGPANSSQTLPSYMYSKAFSAADFGLAAAIGVFLMIVLGLYAIFFLKLTKYNKAGDF